MTPTERREWLTRRTDKPCWVDAPISVRPEKVPGDHISVPLVPGTRTFAFATPEEAASFQQWMSDNGKIQS